MPEIKKTYEERVISSPLISSEVCSILYLLDYRIVRMPPEMMRTKAVKSYLHINGSPKRQIAKPDDMRIAVAELHVNKTRSANGSITKK